MFGGITPQGLINVNFFTERVPLPTKIVLQVDEVTGKVGGVVEREGKEGIVREVNCGILLDISAAKQLLAWLEDKIYQYEKINQEIEKKTSITMTMKFEFDTSVPQFAFVRLITALSVAGSSEFCWREWVT